MQSRTHIVFIPGDVSVNIVEAIRRAANRVRSPPGGLDLSSLTPGVRRALASAMSPVKHTSNLIKPRVYESKDGKRRRIKRELLDCGATFYGLLKSETRVLPKILHPGEHVKAVVYGMHQSNSVMLVATNSRIIYLDKKPMALFLDEVSYEVVSGIEFEIHTFFATLVLHTPVKNYDIRYANLRCAENFARHIETQRLKKEDTEDKKVPEIEILPRSIIESGAKSKYPMELKDDMAGYFLLPMEEEEERLIP